MVNETMETQTIVKYMPIADHIGTCDCKGHHDRVASWVVFVCEPASIDQFTYVVTDLNLFCNECLGKSGNDTG